MIYSSLNPVAIGNDGMLGGLAGSIASIQASAPSSRIVFCDTTTIITEVPGAVTVEIICIGAGGGGGSGCLNTTALSAAGGGGGGGNGGFAAGTYAIAGLIFPLIAAVGAGGNGGASVTGTTASGNTGSSGGSSIVQAMGIVGLTGRGSPPNARTTLMSANGGGGGGGGTTTAGGTAGTGTNNNLDQHFSFMGNPGALLGGFPAPLTPTDTNVANWMIPRGGGGGGGISTADVPSNGGGRSSGRPWFWGLTSAEIATLRDAPRFPYLIGGGVGAIGGNASLTDGLTGGRGWRGSGGGGGGAGRVSSGAGGVGGDGCVILIFR